VPKSSRASLTPRFLRAGELQLDAVAGGDENALGELERQECRGQIGAFERSVDVVDELGVLQLPRRDVDGDADVATERLAQTLVAYRQASFRTQRPIGTIRPALRQRNEVERGTSPRVGCCQRRSASSPTTSKGSSFTTGWYARVNCFSSSASRSSAIRLKRLSAASSEVRRRRTRSWHRRSAYRAVHRGVGLFQQLGAGLPERDPDARRDQEVPLTDVDGSADLVEQTLGDDGRPRPARSRR